MSSRNIDLSADLDEDGPHDDALFGLITSVNVLCGFHVGAPAQMARVVAAAAARNVALGVHLGIDDRAWGHREPTPTAIYEMALYQIGALRAFAITHGQRLQHVKAHGPLAERAAKDAATADAIARAAADHGGHLILVGAAGTEQERSAGRAAIPFAAELLIDVAIVNPAEIVTEAAAVASDIGIRVLSVRTNRGSPVDRIRAIRAGLEGAGVKIEPLRDWL